MKSFEDFAAKPSVNHVEARVRLSPVLLYLALAVAAILAGAVAGASLVQFGPVVSLVLIAIPVGGIAYLRSVWVSYAAVVAVVCLLPFAVIPFSTPAGTPAIIELAILACGVIVMAVVLCDRRMQLPAGPLPAIWLGLVGVTVFAFLLGYGRGYTPQTVHDFGKFLLALGMFLLTLTLVRRVDDAVLVVRMVLAGVAAAASIALMLYVGGPSRTEQALSRLVPYGYPGSRIVRFIEDDPTRQMRAVGTGVDPNSFGGLMAVGAILGAGQSLGRRPVVQRWLAVSAVTLCSVAMLLTYSRGAWIGAFAGIAVILLLRRRALLPVFGLTSAAVVALGFGAGFIDRLWQGFTLQDPATRLRLQEYQNAIEIIRRHPWFGIGFGEAGTIDLQEGVSSTYLTVAEIAGLVGLAIFLLAIGAILLTGFRRILFQPASEITDLQMTVTSAFCGILVIALVDHYFFNIRFPHMAALFWIIAGLIVAIARLPEAQPAAMLELKGTRNDTNA
jgi:polysaccharide biosynthesis protein PslJ